MTSNNQDENHDYFILVDFFLWRVWMKDGSNDSLTLPKSISVETPEIVYRCKKNSGIIHGLKPDTNVSNRI